MTVEQILYVFDKFKLEHPDADETFFESYLELEEAKEAAGNLEKGQ